MSVNQDKLNEQLLNVVLSDKDNVEAKFKKIKYLVKLGADVNANIFGKSILSKVKHADNVKEEVREFLKSIGAKEYVCSKDKAEELGRGFWDENGKVKSLDEIKKSVRDGANLGVFSVNGKQIWKYLSSDEIDELLKILPEGYEIDGGVSLNNMKMTKLPNFSKIKVKGDFECSCNMLSSLEGAPVEVLGDFICFKSGLTSLKGAPLEVLGEFDCSHNELASLEGAPLVVGSFYCRNNRLTSLKGAPKKVKKIFTCNENPLKSLEGKPLEIGGEFFIDDEVLKCIKKREKKAKSKEEFNKAFNEVKSLLSNICEKGR